MANPEHLEILKQGVEAWNKWRKENSEIVPDLRYAYLVNADFYEVNLSGTDLSDTTLLGADLRNSNLSNANLRAADLHGADLSNANLNSANLTEASLLAANLSRADLQSTDFTYAKVGHTIFANTDLSLAKGLNYVYCLGPTYIDIITLYISGGNIPEVFLRSCGVPDTFITFAKSLVGTAIDYYSAFISYSSKNQSFAERLYADLQSKGVRCWFAPEDIKIGDKFRQRIDEAIRIHDKLLVVLSEDSISSAWVEEEVESAMEREHREKRLVLFPVRIDDAVINSDQAWAASLRRMRHIGDFSKWKDHDSYSKAFERLLRDLKSESKA